MDDLVLNDRILIMVVIAITFGLLLGYFMSRESTKRLPLLGGTPAKVFHFLASSTVTAVVPTVIPGIILRIPIVYIIATGLTFTISTYLLLLGYAYFEGQADRSILDQPVRELD